MGEVELKQKVLVKAIKETLLEGGREEGELRLSTPGGRFQVRWDEGGSATALGQLAVFAEFLEVSGLFERWVEGCPVNYTSPNAPKVVDVLGTWLLSILDGQRRYAHVTGLRGDVVAPEILGMKKILSDESLRRALGHLAPKPSLGKTEAERAEREVQLAASTAWMDQALSESVGEALDTPWIQEALLFPLRGGFLDGDGSVKPLYGRQDGAEVSYNPKKPGRPSHMLHTYWIGSVRLVLDVELHSGKAHAPKHGLPRLVALLKGLPPKRRPVLVRGDNAFGNESVMAALEELGQRYLFKLRQSAGVKRLIERQWSRRVVVLRRRVPNALAETQTPTPGRQTLLFAEAEGVKLWEYAVSVTNSDYAQEAIGQLYRDRADCENGFDELKNQWGWGGYTTQDLERCNLSARAVALIYNWWSWYVRLAHPQARREAITSRPLLLAGVARLTHHAGQSRLLVTLTHAAADQIKAMIAAVRKGLDHVLAIAPQLPKRERWRALLRYIIAQILAARPTPPPIPCLLTPPPLAVPSG